MRADEHAGVATELRINVGCHGTSSLTRSFCKPLDTCAWVAKTLIVRAVLSLMACNRRGRGEDALAFYIAFHFPQGTTVDSVLEIENSLRQETHPLLFAA